MLCPRCQADNPADKRFCGACGAALINRCVRCGAENPPANKFCGDCGASLDASESPHTVPDSEALGFRAEAVEEAVEGERKIVTALFADLKGSTALMETLDPEAAHAIVDPVLHIMIDAVHREDAVAGGPRDIALIATGGGAPTKLSSGSC
jgi:hypothetical protein